MIKKHYTYVFSQSFIYLLILSIIMYPGFYYALTQGGAKMVGE